MNKIDEALKVISEEQVEEIIFNHLDELFPNITPKERQFRLNTDEDMKFIVDIYGIDEEKNDCLIELKVGKLGRNRFRGMLGQLLDYSYIFYQVKGKTPKLYAIAEEFSKYQMSLFNRYGIACGEYGKLERFKDLVIEEEEEEDDFGLDNWYLDNLDETDKVIMRFIKTNNLKTGKYTHIDEIIKEYQGIEEDKIRNSIDRLQRSGLIYSPIRNGYKITEY